MPSPLSLEIFPLHRELPPGSEQVTHVLARVRALDIGSRPRPKLSAVLVLDVSGSMLGDPIAHVIQSAQRLTEILSDNDTLGIVAFNEGAHTIAPPRQLTSEARRQIKRELTALVADGNTNISGALAHAALLVPKRTLGERQILMLMSDGEPNVGESSSHGLGEQARLIKDREIAISTLGFGANHNDDVLAAIAERGGGRYAFVVDPKLAESSFIRTLGAQLDVVAERVRLSLLPGDGVEIVRVLDNPPTSFGAGGLRITLSDLIVGDELNVVAQLRVRTPQESGPVKLLRITLSGCHSGSSDTFSVPDYADITINRIGPYDTDKTAHASISIAQAAEMRAEARAHAERGNYAAAASVLRKAQAMIRATPGYVAGEKGPLNDADETLVDEIVVMDQKPKMEEYQRYKKAARDYMDFGTSGALSRSGASLSRSTPSMHALLRRARANIKMPVAYLQILSGPQAGDCMLIKKERFVIGRGGHGTDLEIKHPSLSRQHAIVELMDDGFWLVDMGSTNGITINGRRISRWRLSHGDTFEVGGIQMRYDQP